mmetsp:Transcript_33362/g.24110  ORF Transcript_33362/g.24110 Transcript_33362/m.24110 type:complete len:116 (+) Transcript_33362:187-534(+)
MVSTLLISTASVVTMLARYTSTEMFPFEAYIVLGTAYWFGFMSIGLLAVDLSFTLFNQANSDIENQDNLDRIMNGTWSAVYWGNIIMGSFVIKFYQKYWLSGRFSKASKCKQALK